MLWKTGPNCCCRAIGRPLANTKLVVHCFRAGAISIEKYELRKDAWSQIANMNGRRLQFGIGVIDGLLFVVGGRDGLKTLNTVECFDPKKKHWTMMTPMGTHRHGLG